MSWGFPAALGISLAGGTVFPVAHVKAGTVGTKEAMTHDAYSHLL